MENMYRKLSNGVNIPCIGFGTYKLENDNNQARDLVSQAIELGYRNIDTASYYNNEKGVGEGIKLSGIKREDLFISTKVWVDEQGYENTMKAFNKSLENLGLDYIDLYMIHWPTELTIESWKAMEELYKQKKIRALGVCNFTMDQLEDLISVAEINPMVNQIEVHPQRCEKATLKFCRRHDIIVEAWSPLMRGGLFSNPTLKELSEKYNKTQAQIILRWHLQNNVVAIPKSSNENRIKNNIDIFDFEISKEDMKKIDSIDTGERMQPQEFETLAKLV